MLCNYAEFHYAECRILFIIMLDVIMLSVVRTPSASPYAQLLAQTEKAFQGQTL